MDVGILLLRLTLAGLLTGHACQKLFGWFQGSGRAATAATFHGWGFRPAPALVVLAGTCEILGAGSVALGLLTPAGCAIVIGTMIVAATPNAAKGLWAHLGGCEVPVVYAALAVVLAFTGPGRFSLDRLLGLTGLTHVGWSFIAIAVGVLAAMPPIVRRNTELRRSHNEVTP